MRKTVRPINAGLRKLVIICPFFHGSGSGVATYYQLLAEQLGRRGVELIIISDREKGHFRGKYYRLFPRRCGRNRSRYRDILNYGIQNILYLRLLPIIRSERPESLLIHSSFYNHPGLFIYYAKKLRQQYGGRMVADVRDQLMPAEKIHYLNIYDSIISCSLNVKAHLIKNRAEKEKLVHIPVIQEPLEIKKGDAQRVLLKYGLSENKYIFYAGLVKEEKGVQLLLQTFCHYLQRNDLKLVLAGFNKLKNADAKNMLEHPEVLYIGNQDRNTILALMCKAALCVNLSFSEGMPRASLEAIDLGRPVLLPKGIPEFDMHCPDNVVKVMEPKMVAKQFEKILIARKHSNYPIEQHRVKNTIDQYFEVLFDA